MSEDRATQSISQREKEISNKFRCAIQDILKPEDDNEEYLLRWLRARDFDIVNAEAMIRHSVKFMYNIEADNLLESGYSPSKFALYYLPTHFWGFDKEGSAVRSFLSGINDYKGFCRALTAVDIMKYLTYVVNKDMKAAKENAKKTDGKYNPKIVYIFDFSNFNIKSFLDKLVVKKGVALITMYQDNFPELLKVVFVINVPPLFQVAVNIFKPFMAETTWQKFKFYTNDDWKNELFNLIDMKTIPKSYGGISDTNEVCCDSSLFLKHKTNGGKIPTKHYLKEDSYIKSTDPGVQTIIIPDRATYDYKINVNKCGTVIEWIFQTKNNNIRFGVFFTPIAESEEKTELSVVIEPREVDSYVVPERGELHCDNTGTYVLQFDNTYSWIMKKHILLKVKVV